MSEKNTSARGQSSNATPAAAKPAPQGKNTYLVYVIDSTARLDPVTRVLWIQADKYGPAWKAARSLVATGKPHDEVPNTTGFFANAEGTELATVGYGKHLHIGTVLDPTPPKNAGKIDENRLKAILEDASTSQEDRLAAIQAMISGNVVPAPVQAAA